MSANPPPAAARVRPTAVRWRICALMIAVSFVAYLLRTNMSIAGPPMAADLGLSQIQLGLVFSGFAWGYTIFQFPGGVFGDLMGARRALTALLVLWGTSNLVVGLLPEHASAVSTTMLLVALVALRFAMGAAQAPLFPIIGGGTTCNWFPVSGWALPNAFQNAGATFGAAAAGPLIAWLTLRFGWRNSFLLISPAAFLCAAWWWWYVRDYPSQHQGTNAEERELIDAGRLAADAVPRSRRAWKAVIRDPQVRLLTGGYFCSNFVFYFFFNWLFVYLIESRGFKLLEGGWYSAAPWIAGAVGALAGGWLCDRLWRRVGPRWSCSLLGAAGQAATAVFLLAAARAPHPIVAVVLLSLCLCAQQFTDAIYWAGTIAVAGRHASAACGVLNTGGNLAGGVVALAVPLTVQRLGWPVALGIGSAFALAAAALWLVTAVDRVMGEANAATAPVVEVVA